MTTRANLRKTGRIGLISTALGLTLAVGAAPPATAVGDNSRPQPISKADANPGGANGQCPGGPFCSTRSGLPSLNGNGNGAAVGKPCAGCVGRADNKNPPGQALNDRNAGFECDRNKGIGRTNPAHTGCVAKAVPPRVNPPNVNPPRVNPPRVNPPNVNVPRVNVPNVNVPVTNPRLVDMPLILGASVAAPGAASAVTHPLPTSAAAGEASTSGQPVAGTFAAFAGFLALGAGFILRRRHGDA